MLFVLPEGLSFEQGAALPVSGLSASFLVSQLALSPGEYVATYAAAGGLGCYLGGLWAAEGVHSIGLTSSPHKAALATLAGYADTVDYTGGRTVAAVRERSENLGVHGVVDSVGGPKFADSFRILRNGGTVVLCGTSAGEPSLAEATLELLASRRNLALREFYLVNHIFEHFNELPSRVAQLLVLLQSGRLHVPITNSAFEDVIAAHAALESGLTTGKLVLDLS